MSDPGAGAHATPVFFPVAPGQHAADDDRYVTMVSRGTALVVGPAAHALPAARQLAASLRVVACVPDAPAATGFDANPVVMIARVARVEGRLGRFVALAHQGGAALADLGRFSPNADRTFDVVFDVGSTPLLGFEAGPPGYFAPGPDPDGIAHAVASARTLVGTFRKPRYVRHARALCTHAAQGIAGCARCVDACPAGAIRSDGAALEVDPYLCQGCATCILVCPTGAMAGTASRPPVSVAPGGPDVRTLVIGQDGAASRHVAGTDPDAADRIAIPAIAAAGPADWLGALANGYSRVVIRIPERVPRSTRRALRAQQDLGRALLAALGLPEDSIVFEEEGAAPSSDTVSLSAAAAAPAAPAVNGRLALLAAIDALERRNGTIPGAAPRPLPPGAPFGTVEVDRDRCTLCMACVNLCPTAALTAGDSSSALRFTEAACVQCGLCSRGCPEQAITLQPRLLPGRVARGTARVLTHDRPHRCPECGVAYIGLALVTRAMQVMRESGALDERAIAGLKRCPACRAASSG